MWSCLACIYCDGVMCFMRTVARQNEGTLLSIYRLQPGTCSNRARTDLSSCARGVARLFLPCFFTASLPPIAVPSRRNALCGDWRWWHPAAVPGCCRWRRSRYRRGTAGCWRTTRICRHPTWRTAAPSAPSPSPTSSAASCAPLPPGRRRCCCPPSPTRVHLRARARSLPSTPVDSRT